MRALHFLHSEQSVGMWLRLQFQCGFLIASADEETPSMLGFQPILKKRSAVVAHIAALNVVATPRECCEWETNANADRREVLRTCGLQSIEHDSHPIAAHE